MADMTVVDQPIHEMFHEDHTRNNNDDDCCFHDMLEKMFGDGSHYHSDENIDGSIPLNDDFHDFSNNNNDGDFFSEEHYHNYQGNNTTQGRQQQEQRYHDNGHEYPPVENVPTPNYTHDSSSPTMPHNQNDFSGPPAPIVTNQWHDYALQKYNNNGMGTWNGYPPMPVRDGRPSGHENWSKNNRAYYYDSNRRHGYYDQHYHHHGHYNHGHHHHHGYSSGNGFHSSYPDMPRQPFHQYPAQTNVRNSITVGGTATNRHDGFMFQSPNMEHQPSNFQKRNQHDPVPRQRRVVRRGQQQSSVPRVDNHKEGGIATKIHKKRCHPSDYASEESFETLLSPYNTNIANHAQTDDKQELKMQFPKLSETDALALKNKFMIFQDEDALHNSRRRNSRKKKD